MANEKRTILIVEDDKDLNEQYRMFCQLALASLPELSIVNTYEIRPAYSFEEAIDMLRTDTVDFISVDLALDRREGGLKDKDRIAGNEPGGMRLLKQIHQQARQPIVVVVSGETLLSYARDALQNYDALAYFQKGQPGFEEDYLYTVQSALTFMEGERLLDRVEASLADPGAFDRAENFWRITKELAAHANLSERHFPENLDARISGIRARYYPGTPIPGETWTKDYLRKNIFRTNRWVLFQASIGNFETFAAGQASQVAPLLTFLADLIDQIGKKAGCQNTFAGAWRHENLLGPCILALLPADCLEQGAMSLAEIQQNIQSEFAASAGKFVHGWAISHDHGPLPELVLRVWNGADEPFCDFPELVDKLSVPAR